MMKTNQRLWPYILLVNIAVYVTLMFCLNLTQRDTTSGKRSTWGHAWATENWTLFRESLAVSVDSQVKVGIGFAGLDRHVEEISAKLKDMDSHVRWLHDGVQWNIRSAGSRAENQSATASGSRFGNNSGAFALETQNGAELSPGAFLRIYRDQCKSELVPQQVRALKPCPCVPHTLKGREQVDTDTSVVRSLVDVKFLNPDVERGGHFRPAHCAARSRVAVVVPYRDRKEHLPVLLKYLHPLLQRQQLEYRIFVVEQAAPETFNKASLMNGGYLEVKKLFDFDCVVFHDVDMIPEDDRNFYSCINSPLHLGAYIDKFKYKLLYPRMFGGALLFRPSHFQQVNGFSNQFFGWGGEDDDMYHRVNSTGLKAHRYPVSVARYRMVAHWWDAANPANTQRLKVHKIPKGEYARDGLNNVRYEVRTIENRTLYTWIFLNLTESGHVRRKRFIYQLRKW